MHTLEYNACMLLIDGVLLIVIIYSVKIQFYRGNQLLFEGITTVGYVVIS